MRDPVACFPKAAQTKFGSIRCQGQGGEREEADGVRVLWRQQPGLVWMSKAIAQQPTHAVEKASDAESWWAQACRPHGRCFVC